VLLVEVEKCGDEALTMQPREQARRLLAVVA